MWIVVPTYRGTLEAIEFRDDATCQQIEALIPGNWFGSSKETKEEAIAEAKEAGVEYVEPRRMMQLRERLDELRLECQERLGGGKGFESLLFTDLFTDEDLNGVRKTFLIPVPPETCPEDADP